MELFQIPYSYQKTVTKEKIHGQMTHHLVVNIKIMKYIFCGMQILVANFIQLTATAQPLNRTLSYSQGYLHRCTLPPS